MAVAAVVPYIFAVLGFLRFVGVMNAAIWFGGLIFFTFSVGPAFFSPEMLDVFGGREHAYARAWAGRAAQIILDRYFLMQQLCAGIAVAHLVAEWLYTGKQPQRFLSSMLVTLFLTGLLGGWWLQPKLSGLHLTRYGTRSTPEQRVEAARDFKFWHGVSQAVNLLVLSGVGFHCWRTIRSSEDPRFVDATQPYGR